MPFPFTFKLVVPGLPNPFAALTKPAQPLKPPVVDSRPSSGHTRRRCHSPPPSFSPPVIVPRSRKRRWQPSSVEPSQSTTIASTTGYLDTPHATHMMSSSPAESEHEYGGVDPELPPPKRRRTLAGSIVSTALSACLIGTAVGLTVYRLWRTRGKESEQITPPPPYQREWTHVPPQPQSIRVTPSTPRSARKSRHTHTPNSSKHVTVHNRRPRIRPQTYTPPPHNCSPTRPEFDFGHSDHAEEGPAVENQMDWIGDKLTMLIEQGKKALGTEVVVMSDAKEDEVDDGTGSWEEENPPLPSGTSHSRSGSLRRGRTPHALPIPSPSHPHAHTCTYSHSSHSHASPPLGSSPSTRSSMWFDTTAGLPISPARTTRGTSIESDTRSSPGRWEDESAWASPELRESMEKARARYLRSRDPYM